MNRWICALILHCKLHDHAHYIVRRYFPSPFTKLLICSCSDINKNYVSYKTWPTPNRGPPPPSWACRRCQRAIWRLEKNNLAGEKLERIVNLLDLDNCKSRTSNSLRWFPRVKERSRAISSIERVGDSQNWCFFINFDLINSTRTVGYLLLQDFKIFP